MASRMDPKEENAPAKDLSRRRLFKRLSIWGIFAFLGAQAAIWIRTLFPRTRLEGPRFLEAGKVEDFKVGVVDRRFLSSHKVWIVRTREGIYALYARCTHLGCTPAWVETVKKFKCPCHGSGFAMDGTTLEGPAPTPLERFPVSLDSKGVLVVDLGRRIHKRRDGTWSGPGSFLPLRPGEK